MASDSEASCENDPNFAVICAFFQQFGVLCGLPSLDFLELQRMIENTETVSPELIDLHIKLLRKAKKTVQIERWERVLIRFCHGYSSKDAWEIERFGYKKAKLSCKIRVLKELLESQFDCHIKLKNEINKLSSTELRSQPLGKDKHGHSYWFQSDDNYQIRVYKEDLDEETWTLMAKDRDGLVALINELADGDSKQSSDSVANEDSNSLSEKPLVDTGQTESSSSDSTKLTDTREVISISSKSESDPSLDAKEDTSFDVTEDHSVDSKKDNALDSKEDLSVDDKEDPSVDTKKDQLLDAKDDSSLDTKEDISLDAKENTSIDTKQDDSSLDTKEDISLDAKENTSIDTKQDDTSLDAKEEPKGQENIKRPRTDSDGENSNAKREKVFEEIEEPVMIIRGEGAGAANESYFDNPIIGETIEEDVFYVCGEGSGFDCQTGNEQQEKTVETSKNAPDKLCNSSISDKSDFSETVSDSKETILPNEVPSSPTKSSYKLGTIIDSKTDKLGSASKSPAKKSRWDIEMTNEGENRLDFNKTPPTDYELHEEREGIDNEDKGSDSTSSVTPKKSMFFFGSFKPNALSPVTMGFGQTSPSKQVDTSIDRNLPQDLSYKKDLNKTFNETETSKTVKNSKCTETNINKDDHINNSKNESDSSNTNNCVLRDELNNKEPKSMSKLKDDPKTSSISKKTTLNSDEKCKEVSKKALVKDKKNMNTKEKQFAINLSVSCSSEKSTVNPKVENSVDDAESVGMDLTKLKDDSLTTKYNDNLETKQSVGNDKNRTELLKVPKEGNGISEMPEHDNLNLNKEKTQQVEKILTETSKSNTLSNIGSQIESDSSEEGSSTLNETSEPQNNEDKMANKNIGKDVLDNNSSNTNKVIMLDNDTKSRKDIEDNNLSVDNNETEKATKVDESKISNIEVSEPFCEKKVAYKCGLGGKESTSQMKNDDNSIEKDSVEKNNKEMSKETQKSCSSLRSFRTKMFNSKSEQVEINNESKKAEASENSTNKRTTRGQKQKDSNTPTPLDDTVDKKAKLTKLAKNKGKKSETNSASSEVNSPQSTNNSIETDDSGSLTELPETVSPKETDEETDVPEKKPMNLTSLSFDFVESPTPTPTPVFTRSLRKRGHDAELPKQDVGLTGGKKMKLKGKRSMDPKLRKSIEEKKNQQGSSSEEDQQNNETSDEEESSNKKEDKKSEKKEKAKNDDKDAKDEEKPKRERNKHKRMLSNLGITDTSSISIPTTGIRQSRRLAQLKIKEQVEGKESHSVEDERSKKSKSKRHKDHDKDYKEKRKKENDECQPEQEEKKKHKKKKNLTFDENRPWQSSSESSDSVEEEEDEEAIEDDDEPLVFKSDHEFSPESDIEDEDYKPTKRARTARKESDVDEVDECPCQKCGKSDHPEWILLCDRCDNGWHCSCLRPPLLVIPEGDWFCPPCQHIKLLENLQEQLVLYDKKLSKKVIEDRRKERLAYVGISLNNVLSGKSDSHKKKIEVAKSPESSSEDGSSYESESDSDEPIYQLRQRRQAQSYKFNDYDDLIRSAIQDDIDEVKDSVPQSRGKDIATIVNANRQEQSEEKPTVVPKINREENELNKEKPVVVRKRGVGKRRHRKLNSLDISSEDDAESDEDFKGSSSESEEEEEDLGSEDDSDEQLTRGGKRKKFAVRRSTRQRTARYDDADFINDSDDDAPRKKKRRSIWDESEDSEEDSDGNWGKRRKKSKKKRFDDSDIEQYRKRKSKIKYGGLHSSEEETGRGRRTRGKKTTYVDTLGSDSEEDYRRSSRRIESDEDEYVANEEDSDEDEKDSEEVVDDNSTDDDEPLKVPKLKIKNKNKIIDDDDEEEEEDKLKESKSQQLEKDKRLKNVNTSNSIKEENKTVQNSKTEVLQPSAKIEVEPLKEVQDNTTKPPEKIEKKLDLSFVHKMQEPVVSNVAALMNNDDSNDELSEPPGVSLPFFDAPEITMKKVVKGKAKKTLEETLASLGSVKAMKEAKKESDSLLKATLSEGVNTSNIEIAAPPQPFSQSQPTPSVITRMLQAKPGQATVYPVGTIRPKQFATMADSDEESPVNPRSRVSPPPPQPGQFMQGSPRIPLGHQYRPMPPNPNQFQPPPVRNITPHHVYHRQLDPSPSGGGPINMTEHNVPQDPSSPGSKKENVSYNRPLPTSNRFPVNLPSSVTITPVRPPNLMSPQHIPPPVRPMNSLSPYPPNIPTSNYYAGTYSSPTMTNEDVMPAVQYQDSPYSEQYEQSGNQESVNKTSEEETSGEFGGLVSYFSSQHEDDLET